MFGRGAKSSPLRGGSNNQIGLPREYTMQPPSQTGTGTQRNGIGAWGARANEGNRGVWKGCWVVVVVRLGLEKRRESRVESSRESCFLGVAAVVVGIAVGVAAAAVVIVIVRIDRPGRGGEQKKPRALIESKRPASRSGGCISALRQAGDSSTLRWARDKRWGVLLGDRRWVTGPVGAG